MADAKKADDVKAEDEVLEALKDEEQESPAESSPEKTEDPKKSEEEKPEAVKDKEEPKSPETAEEDKTEEKSEDVEEPAAEDKPSEDKGEPKGKAEERKQQLNTEIRDLVSKRNALKQEVAKANEVYQPATEEELIDEGMPATEAKVEALRQQMEIRDYNERVAEAQLTLSSEAERVLNDFPWANPESESYKEEIAKEAATLLDTNLIRDPNNQQVIGSNLSPYQLYKIIDSAKGLSEVEGQLKGQQATEEMLANADSPASTAPTKKAEDPILQILRSDD